MKKSWKYRGAFRNAAIRVFLYGILTGCFLELAALFAAMGFQGEAVYWLYRFFRWPTGIFTGMAVSGCVVLMGRTTVELGEGEITIGRFGRRKRFALSQFVDSTVIRKTHIGSYSKYTTVKCYFIFAMPDGIWKCRLYGFGEKDLEKILEAVRHAQAACMTEEEKAAVVKDYGDEAFDALRQGREGENEFLLPAAVLIRKEKACMKKICLVTAVVMVIAGILDIRAILADHMLGIQLLSLTMLALALAVLVAARYVGLAGKEKICAGRIVIEGEHLLVGREYYSYAGVDRIRLTSPRKRNDSVFPVQRYLYVSAAGKTRRYWLGSEVSFDSYERLCRRLEEGMVLYPDKMGYR